MYWCYWLLYRDCTADVYYYTQENKDILTVCGGLALANSQIPTQPLLPSLSSAWQGEKIGWERTCIDIKTGRLLANYPHRQNRLDFGKINLIYCQLQYILVGRNKGKHNIKTFPLPPSQDQLHSFSPNTSPNRVHPCSPPLPTPWHLHPICYYFTPCLICFPIFILLSLRTYKECLLANRSWCFYFNTCNIKNCK